MRPSPQDWSIGFGARRDRAQALLAGQRLDRLTVLVEPRGVPRSAVAAAAVRGDRVLAFAPDLSPAHAALLFVAGVDGFSRMPSSLPFAARSTVDHGFHFEPISALAVLHLVRSLRDPAFDALAAATHACAAGHAWPLIEDTELADLADSLRQQLR